MREALAAALTSTYVCGRVWDAWNVGTMDERDFQPAAECDELLDELVHAVATAAPQPPQSKPLTTDQMYAAIRPLFKTDALAEAALSISFDEYQAIEAAHGIKEHNV